MYRLDLPKDWKIHDTFHPVHLRPLKETPQYGPIHSCPPPEMVNDEE